MDPNEALKTARKYMAIIRDAGDGTEGRAILEAAEELADAFFALDRWLTHGGFKPAAWDNGV